MIRGVEIDQEEYLVGDDLSASLNDTLTDGEMFFKASAAQWQYQENTVHYRLGRVSVLGENPLYMYLYIVYKYKFIVYYIISSLKNVLVSSF